MKVTQVWFRCDGEAARVKCEATSPPRENAALARAAARDVGWQMYPGIGKGYDRPSEPSHFCPEHR